MLALEGSPYAVAAEQEDRLLRQVRQLEERVDLLRGAGKLTPETLARFYENTRLVDVTESNAIEGSTLGLHETELAIFKGTTLTGHDPGYSRDARALFKAFERLAHLAKRHEPTDILQLKELHEILLGDRPGAGLFRNQEVRIRGAKHVPPRNLSAVLTGMEQWETWSTTQASLPAPFRAVVLHAWLTHVHPFLDGNGRSARAVTTLELVRAGYPPLIIRRKDRNRYYEALAEADDADLGPLMDLMLSRANDALRDLERAAGAQGYTPAMAALRKRQQSHLAIWNKAVELLLANVKAELSAFLEAGGGTGTVQDYDAAIDLEEYIALTSGNAISDAWAFAIHLHPPGCKPISRLAWIGYRSDALLDAMGANATQGPTLFWSSQNPPGTSPRWRKATSAEAPAGDELTYAEDGWVIRKGYRLERVGPSEVARRVLGDLVSMA